jgi:hypothetical protein
MEASRRSSPARVSWQDDLKRRSDAALLKVLHPGTVPDPDSGLTPSGAPDFDGGVRTDSMPPAPTPEWIHDPEDRGRRTIEIEDGAHLFFPHLRGR